MWNWLLVGIGGFFGSSCRYLVTIFVSNALKQPLLPYGTMIVNILGCFAIGLLGSLGQHRQWFGDTLFFMITVGFLGGFTTFSSFGAETYYLIEQNHMFMALLDVALQVGVGITAVGGGFWLGQVIFA